MKKYLAVHSAILIFTLLSYAQESTSWHVVATDINPNAYYGITVANGMIGLISSPDPMKVKEVVLNGAYDHYGRGRVSNILKGLNFLNMELEVDGRRINGDDISHLVQTLDMKQAILTNSFEVEGKLSVKYSFLALRHLPYTALIDVELVALQEVEVTPINLIEAPDHLKEVRNYYSVIDRPHVQIPLMTSLARSPTGKHEIAAAISYIIPGDPFFAEQLIHEDWDYNRHLTKFTKKLKKGEKLSFSVVGSVISTAEVDDVLNEAERLTVYAMLEGRDRLLNRHVAAWKELWQSDIRIEGNDEDQRAVRSMLYHLYSFARPGTAYSLSPMGLSGLGYNGHVFWDTELWMYPALLVLQPEIARSLLEYRWERLEAARQNAFAHGYKGAMFPWESAEAGQEATPVWALTGPFQHHITGCVGWAFWKYYQVTADKIWLRERGYPMLKEVADFWVSRVERNGPGNYEIKNVIGANEWEENIDNNAFTNGMAITVLGYATQAAKELGITPDPEWEHVAENIPVLHFPDGTTKENSTYEGANIKQADVNLLAYPLNIIRDREQIQKDLDYYAPRMAKDGPAMGFAVLATLTARLGDEEKAYRIFRESYQKNEVPPFGVLAETAGGTNPYFATGAGGVLQTMLAGFGGLEITNDGIIQTRPVLPSAWKSLSITGVGPLNTTFEVVHSK